MFLLDKNPGHSLITEPPEGCPPRWAMLLKQGAAATREQLVDVLDLPAFSKAAPLLRDGKEFGILVPDKKGRRNNPRFWQLALTAGDDALYFSANFGGPYPFNCPYEYLDLIAAFGEVSIGQHGDKILHTPQPVDVDDDYGSRSGVAFCGDIFGNFYCWLEDEFEVHFFDHETSEFDFYSTGGFGAWFEKIFRRWFIDGHADDSMF